MSSGALPPSAPISTSVAALVSGSNWRLRSFGSMESNFEYHRDSAGHDQRNHLACSKWSAAAFFLNLTYATRKPLNGLAYAKTSKMLNTVEKLDPRGF
jgi:hypothetical protein